MTVACDNIDALTGLRFVAAFAIVLGHSYSPWLEVTAIGMPLFFTLSGFIIHYVYAETFGRGWGRATTEFAVARFSRLYPLYFVLLAYLIIRTPMGRSLVQPRNFTALFAYLTASWTWWPFTADGHPIALFFVSWSVSTEIFFYVCYALLLYRVAKIRSVRTCLIVLIVFCIAAYAFFLWVVHHSRHLGTRGTAGTPGVRLARRRLQPLLLSLAALRVAVLPAA
ncbi:MAG TPA: acyltransferase family protein [Stellaceae bacterium]|nr:acyltransferase family protein [Stellaceae bacterium]